MVLVISVIAAKGKRKFSDFRKMKFRARFSFYSFVKTFKSRSRIFKQGSRSLGKSRILPFATPNIQSGHNRKCEYSNVTDIDTACYYWKTTS